MKTFICVLVFLAFTLGMAFADVINSYAGGGPWNDPNTWQGFMIPGADDDVVINGPVFLQGTATCQNLLISGPTASLRNVSNQHATLTVLGSFENHGLVSSNTGSYYLHLQIHGDLTVAYDMNPRTIVIAGEGNKTLTCWDSNPLKADLSIEIEDTVDTLFASGNAFIQKGGSSPVLLKGSSQTATIFLPLVFESLASHLTLSDCKTQDLEIVGTGSSTLSILTPGTGSTCYHKDLRLANLNLAGSIYLQTGVVFDSITNTGIVQNYGTYADLYCYGTLINLGSMLSNPSGYALRIHAYGDVNNQGNISIQHFYIKGAGDRVYSFASGSPLIVDSTIDVADEVGTIYAGSNLVFYANNFTGPAELKAYSPALVPASIHLENPLASNLSIEGVSGSILSANTARFTSCQISTLRLEGTISLATTCQLYDVVNYANLQNSNSGSHTATIWGDFENYGTIRDNPVGYSFTVYAMNDVLNYGSWTCYKLDLRGLEPQAISFGEMYPFAGDYLSRSQSSEAVILLDHFYIQGSDVNLNYSPLDLTNANYSVHTQTVALRNCSILSTLDSGLYLSQDSNVYTVAFQSITNHGYLNIGSATTFTGDLVNHGTIQNSSNGSHTLKVHGYLHNYSEIRNRPSGFTLSMEVKGAAYNFGTWTCNSLVLNGTVAQDIRFGDGHPLAVSSFAKTLGTGAINVVGEDLYVENCSINLYGNPLELSASDWDLHMQTSYISSSSSTASIITNPNCELYLDSASWIQSISFASVTNRGYLNIRSNITINGDFTNHGTVQNQTGSLTFIVMGDILNHGSMISNPTGYTLSLNAWGDVINRGDMSCQTINLYGDEDQLLSFPQAYPLSSQALTDQNSGTAIYSDGDIYIGNCSVNLSTAQLNLSTGNYDLYLESSILSNAVLISGLESNLDMSGVSYLVSCSFQSICLSGMINLNSNTPFSGDLINSGIIQNYPTGSYTLTIGGNLINNGTIRSNPSGFSLYLSLAGNLINNDTMDLHTVNLNGSEEQQISNTGQISCDNMIDLVSTSPIRMMTDLMLQNVNLDLRGATLIMSSPTREAYTLGLDGGYLYRAIVNGGAQAVILLANNAYLGNVEADELTLQGAGHISSSVSIGTLQNYATITNAPTSSQTLSLGQLNNYGSIANHQSYSFYLDITGNLYNYANLAPRRITFSSPNDQSIYQSATSDTIRIENLYKTGSGNLIMQSDLRIKGASIDLNDHSLVMHNNPVDFGLYMVNCYLYDAYLDSENYAVLNASGNSRLINVSGQNLQIWGNTQIFGSSGYDNLINYGLITNSTSSSQSMNIYGNLINYGQIENLQGYSFTVLVGGDLINYGTMSNYQISMNGTLDQEILVSGIISVPNLVLISDLGSAQWWHDGIYTGTTTSSLNLGALTPQLMGNWQTYLAASNTWGRIVHIYTEQALGNPTGLSISRSDTSLILVWNQVPGAASYKIYASAKPEVGFGLLIDQIVDNDPADGTVQQIIPITSSRTFYRITAQN